MATSVIKANPDIIVHSQTIIYSGTETSGHEDNATPDSISGYTPIGIVGWHEQTDTSVFCYNCKYISSINKINIGWKTINGSKLSTHGTQVDILYKRNL